VAHVNSYKALSHFNCYVTPLPEFCKATESNITRATTGCRSRTCVPSQTPISSTHYNTTNTMMRKSGAASMQKCYDEGYLSCSLAVYYESQVRFSLAMTTPIALVANLHRITKQKPFAPGAPPSTRSTTTMPTNYRPVMFRGARPKKPYTSHYEQWKSSAKRE
jgi:hypothetical protein